MGFDNCKWTRRPLDTDYLSPFAFNPESQAQNDESHRANAERLESLPPFEKIFEYKRMKYVGFTPYTNGNFWADQIYQRASSEMRQPLFDYLMSLDERDRGNMFTNLYFLHFAEVPTDSETYWAD